MIPMLEETDAISCLLNERNAALNRIEELECALGQAELDHKELTAENQRLREGLKNILLHTLRNANYTYDVRLANDLLDNIARKATILLGGGENG